MAQECVNKAFLGECAWAKTSKWSANVNFPPKWGNRSMRACSLTKEHGVLRASLQISWLYKETLEATLIQDLPISILGLKANLGSLQHCDSVYGEFGSVETLCHKRKFLLTAYQDTASYFNQDPTGSQSLQGLELPSGVASEVTSLNDCFTTCVDTEVYVPLWHCLGKS